MSSSSALKSFCAAASATVASDSPAVLEPPSFDEVYAAYFPFVWRTVRRLGIPESALEDVAQEIFVTVHRRMPTFERRSSLKTWIFGIAVYAVRNYRRAHRRRARWIANEGDPSLFERVPDPRAEEAVSAAFQMRLLEALLESLDEEKREVFVLVEVAQMTVPEVAEALSINVNTAYARLRAARGAFEVALSRHLSRDARGHQGGGRA